MKALGFSRDGKIHVSHTMRLMDALRTAKNIRLSYGARSMRLTYDL